MLMFTACCTATSKKSFLANTPVDLPNRNVLLCVFHHADRSHCLSAVYSVSYLRVMSITELSQYQNEYIKYVGIYRRSSERVRVYNALAEKILNVFFLTCYYYYSKQS